MTAVADDVGSNALSSWFQQPPEYSMERDAEQTAVLPVTPDEPVRKTPDGDAVSGPAGDDRDRDDDTRPLIAAGWFQHYLHRLDTDSQSMTMADGELVLFAACNFLVGPPAHFATRPDWPYCPVCWDDQAGHDFAWEYKPKGVVARCTRTGCGRTHPEIYDPAARRDPARRGQGAVDKRDPG